MCVLLLMIFLLFPLSVQAFLPFPAQLTQIRESAFEGDLSLSGLLSLPENIETVGDRAFASSNIYALKLPAGCRQVGADVLEGTPAAYIYQESSETALSADTLDDVSFLFSAGQASNIDQGIIHLNDLKEYDGFYYYQGEEGLYLLCPVDGTAVANPSLIPPILNGQSVFSLDYAQMPGCENVLLKVPAHLSIPASLYAEPYEMLSVSKPLCDYTGEMDIGIPYTFTASVSNAQGEISCLWTVTHAEYPDAPQTFTTSAPALIWTAELYGYYDITLTVTDETGLSASATTTICICEPNPPLDLPLEYASIWNSNKYLHIGETSPFYGTTFVGVYPITYAWSIQIGESFYTLPDTGDTIYVTPETEGELTVYLTVTDAIGDTASTSITLPVYPLDYDPPELTDILCSSESPVSHLPYIYTASGNHLPETGEYHWHISNCCDHLNFDCFMDCQEFEFTTSAPSLEWIAPTAEEYYIKLTVAEDAFGNAASLITSFSYAPCVVIRDIHSSPEALSAGSEALFTGDLTVSSGISPVYAWTFSYGEKAVTLPSSAPALSFTPVQAGMLSITLTASVGTESWEYTKDFPVSCRGLSLTAPVTTAKYPIAGTAYPFTAEASCDCSAITYTWQFDEENGSTTLETNVPSCEYTPRGGGQCLVNLTATDEDGHSESASSSFTFSGGEILLTGPEASSSLRPGEECEFTVGVTGAVGEIRYQWEVANSGVTLVSGSDGPSYAYSPFSVGVCSVTVTVTDEAGVTASASKNFNVSNFTLSLPRISGDLTVDGQVEINISFSGNEGNVLFYYEITTPDGFIFYYKDVASCTVYYTPTVKGAYRLYVSAADAKGNTDSVTCTFEIGAEIVNPVAYRAFLVGNTYPGTINELAGPDNDVYGMEEILSAMPATPYTVDYRINATASAIQEGIAAQFADADSNDISLFYYSGHGTSAGSLCGTQSTYISVDQLRSCLDAIPGTKIVLLDCCYSGAHIDKSSSSVSAFNNAVISAFSARSKAIAPAPIQEGFSLTPRANLAAQGYIVLTASSKATTSASLNAGDRSFGVFTYGLCDTVGFDLWENAWYGSMYGDYNQDKAISVSEAVTCVQSNEDYFSNLLGEELIQNVQYYGDTAFILWAR